jgi:hypothetical protein
MRVEPLVREALAQLSGRIPAEALPLSRQWSTLGIRQ